MKLTTKILENYDNMVIEHKYFNTAASSVLSHIQYGSKGRILMVVGPTGVGKTTLINYSVSKLNEFVEKYPEKGFTAPLVLEAPAPEKGSFNWASFYSSALNTLSEPGVHAKSNLDKSVAMLSKTESPLLTSKFSSIKLRELFEQSIRNLRPIAIFIDEIQHLVKCKTEKRKTDNLDVIKSLSNTLPTSFILTGTYEAREMMYHGGQLSRRVHVEHFQRYQNSDAEMAIFNQVFKSIIHQYEIPTTKAVMNNIDFLYNHSLGCIGILATWLRISIEHGISENSKELQMKHLQKSRLNNIQLSSILQEIDTFEYEHNHEQDFDIESFIFEKKEEQKKKDKKISSTPNQMCKTKPFSSKPKRDVLQGAV